MASVNDISYPVIIASPEELQKIADLVTDLLQSTAKDPSQYPEAENLDGLTSLPCFNNAFTLVRASIALLKGVDGKSAFQLWQEQPGNADKTLSDFFASMKGEKGDPFTYEDFTPEQLESLILTFDKLTPEQVQAFWQAIPEEYVTLFQKPATDAAAEVRVEMTRISQEVSQVIDATNTAKTNAETATTNANTAATAANTAAGLATNAADNANTAAGIAVEAATLADNKAEQAGTAARNAITATEDAINATTDAITATGLANAAATAANTAKDNAETATDSANSATARANTAAEAAENIVKGFQSDWSVSDPSDPNYIKNKPEIPTLNVIPSSATLSYVNSSGTTVDFNVGDEVRVQENGEYVFYKLYDLADGVASWQEAGSGTALPGNIYLQGANYYNDSVTEIKEGYINE